MFKSLKTLLDNSFTGPQSWKTKLLSDWPEIVGNLHDKMCLEKVYDDTLVIGVYNTSWLQELYMLSSVIVKTVNQNLEQPYIKKIRFKHTSRKKTVKTTIKKEQPIAAREKVQLNSYETQALLKIKDEEMRTALHLFLSRCKTK